MKSITLVWSAVLAGLILYSSPAAEPSAPIGEARFLSNIRQLTIEGRRSGEGYFSPDGKSLIFQSERDPANPFYQIYILDLESGDSHRVSPGMGKTTCSFFRPGSDEVLFASTHLDPDSLAKQKAELDLRASGQQKRYSWDYDEKMDIFSCKRDGSGLKQLTTARGYDAEGNYSPDGSQIVFCSLRDAYPPEKLSPENRKRLETDPSYFGEIYLMNADGSNQRRLTDSPGYDGGPFFSPDGQRIVWRHFTEDGLMADVYTMKTDGSDQRRITDFKCMSWAPYYHPSGKYFIFNSNKLGFSNFELYIVDVEGRQDPVRVTFTDGFDGLPVFSPDGKKLCWTSGRTADGKSQLFMADWNHEAALAALGTAPVREIPPLEELSEPAPPPRTTAPDFQSLSPAIRVDDLRAEVGYLASDSLEGRMTGSRGSRAAADFLGEYLKSAGLQPLGDDGTYFQKFDFNATVKMVTNLNKLTIIRTQPSSVPSIKINEGFRPLSFTANGVAEGQVVFAGYGLQLPGKPGEGYDSYAGLDVTNKIVLILRYVPEDVPPTRKQELNRFAGLRYKALQAREHGARGILFVTGPNSPNAGELVDFGRENALSGSGIVAATISGEVAEALMSNSSKTLKQLQTALDKEDPHAETGVLLSGVSVRITTYVQQIKGTDRNVVGVIPPAEGSAEYVVVGAHYDHLGYGESGAMRRKGEERAIHNGADDNASGSAAVMELAANLADERKTNPGAFKRGIIFALWSGEEIGLVGSSYFGEHPPVPLSNVVAYVNFDMVGRLRENKLILNGIGSSSVWKRLLEKRNIAGGFNLVLLDDPFAPTDVTTFYPKNVPVLAFFTGSHEDYHRPTDKAPTLNYEGIERVVKFAKLIVRDLASSPDRPDYLKVENRDTGGGRDMLRVYLGTIPDYTTDVQGVKLSGVRAGGPADKAGLKGGDVIVEFGSQKVLNINDYTFALDSARIGKPIDVVVLRDGQRVTITVTPEARK